MILDFKESLSELNLLEACLIENVNRNSAINEILSLFNEVYASSDTDEDSTILKEALDDVIIDFSKIIKDIIAFITDAINNFIKWLTGWASLIIKIARTMPVGVPFDSFTFNGYKYTNTFSTTLMDDLDYFGYQTGMNKVYTDIDLLSGDNPQSVSLKKYEIVFPSDTKSHIIAYYRPKDKEDLFINEDELATMVMQLIQYKSTLKGVTDTKNSVNKDLSVTLREATHAMKSVNSDDVKNYGGVLRKWNILLSNFTAYANVIELIISTKIKMLQDEVVQIRMIQSKALERVHII